MVELHEAKIKTLMVTGDNQLTAIAIARKCELFPPELQVVTPVISNGELKWRVGDGADLVTGIEGTSETEFTIAMTGADFDWIAQNRMEIMNSVLVKSHVFARFEEFSIVIIFANEQIFCIA